MSTIKSSAENLTLNADGANNDIKFQSNGSEVASIDQGGTLVLSNGVTAGGTISNANGTITGKILDSTTPDISTGENNGIRLVNTGGGGTTWHMTAGQTGQNNSTFVLRNGVSNVDAIKVDTSGNVNIGAGDLFFGTAGKGIVLGATSNVDANTLSDYETGTWTVVASGSSSGSGNVGTGIYTKIGRIVHINIIIVSSTFPTFSGSLQMSLPFTGSNQSSREERGADIYFYPLASWTQGSNFNGCVPYVYGANPTVMLFSSKNMSSDRQTPIGNTASGDGGVYARFSMTYTAT